MMFNKDNDIEFQSIETIKSFQEEKLKEALEYLKAHGFNLDAETLKGEINAAIREMEQLDPIDE